MSRIAVSIADWNPSESEFDECIKLLDSEPLEQRKILSKTRKDDRIRSFVGRILIRFALSCHSGLNPSEMRLSRSAAGKPFLIQDSDAPERLGFNLSHEGDWVALAFSIGSEQIGCDLAKIEVLQTEEKGEQKNESIQKQLMFIQSFEKILTADEMKNLRFLQEIQCWADHIFLFYALWTVKEAFSKAIGQGLLLHFKRISVSVDLQALRRLRIGSSKVISGKHIQVWLDNDNLQNWLFTLELLSEAYLLATAELDSLARSTFDVPTQYKKTSINELLKDVREKIELKREKD